MARPRKNKVEESKDDVIVKKRIAYDLIQNENGKYSLITIEYDLQTKQGNVIGIKQISDTLETAKYKFDVLTYKKLLKED